MIEAGRLADPVLRRADLEFFLLIGSFFALLFLTHASWTVYETVSWLSLGISVPLLHMAYFIVAFSIFGQRRARDFSSQLARLVEAERARAEYERELDHLLRMPLSLLLVMDRHGDIRCANEAWRERLEGWDQNLLGSPFLDLVHPDDRPKARSGIEAAKAGAGLRRFHVRCRTGGKDGYTTLLWAVLYRPDTGRLYGSAQDISHLVRIGEELRQARREAEDRAEEAERGRRTLESLLECLPQAIVVADAPDARLRFVSPHALSRLGREAWEIVGRQERELVERWLVLHPDTRIPATPEETPIIRAMHSGESIADEEWIIRDASGLDVHVLCNAVAIKDGDGAVTGAVLAWRDISRLKRLEAELRAAKDDAEAASQAKSVFLANMSHELRTPLNGVLGMAELAMREDRPELIRDHLRLVKHSARLLLHQLNNVLDLSRLEAGTVTFDPAPFDPRRELEGVLQPLQAVASQKGLRLLYAIDPDVPCLVVGDAGRLRQVLVNVVDNAIKFTEQGRVAVTMGLNREDGEDGADGEGATGTVRLAYTVRDDGVGIARDRLPGLFTGFGQSGGSAHVRYGGAGLGLSIARGIVERMGGRMWVESEEGRGSTFSFTVEVSLAWPPLVPNHQPEPGPVAREGALSLLLVEDNAVNRLLATELLRSDGHAVDTAENGLEALDKLRVGAFDLVLMDVRMPVMDGLEATRRIRCGEAGAANASIPIIALTAHSLAVDRERQLAAGMTECLAKPLDVEALEQMLARLGKATRPAKAEP